MLRDCSSETVGLCWLQIQLRQQCRKCQTLRQRGSCGVCRRGRTEKETKRWLWAPSLHPVSIEVGLFSEETVVLQPGCSSIAVYSFLCCLSAASSAYLYTTIRLPECRLLRRYFCICLYNYQQFTVNSKLVLLISLHFYSPCISLPPLAGTLS